MKKLFTALFVFVMLVVSTCFAGSNNQNRKTVQVYIESSTAWE